MEPITTTIVAVLVAGITAGTKGVATQAVKDAYAGLRRLIVDRYKRAGAVAMVEEDPASEAGQKALADALARAGADADPEVQRRAAELGAALQGLPAEAKTVLKVQLKDIEAGQNILLERLASTGSAELAVEKAKAGGDFALRDLSAGAHPKNQ